MDRATAIRKVLACLRLSKSSNPNEAAAALRQARALMEKFGLSEDDAAAAEVREFAATTRSRGLTPPRSVLWLAHVIAGGYRCTTIVRCIPALRGLRPGKTDVAFFGGEADAQVAAYAFEVLNRQLTADRVKHTARIRKRANKDRRGEEFALGWVHAVKSLFPAQELSEERARAIAAAVRATGPTEKTSGREIGKTGRTNPNDSSAGYRAGKDARLHQGVGGSEQRRLVQP